MASALHLITICLMANLSIISPSLNSTSSIIPAIPMHYSFSWFSRCAAQVREAEKSPKYTLDWKREVSTQAHYDVLPTHYPLQAGQGHYHHKLLVWPNRWFEVNLQKGPKQQVQVKIWLHLQEVHRHGQEQSWLHIHLSGLKPPSSESHPTLSNSSQVQLSDPLTRHFSMIDRCKDGQSRVGHLLQPTEYHIKVKVKIYITHDTAHLFPRPTYTSPLGYSSFMTMDMSSPMLPRISTRNLGCMPARRSAIPGHLGVLAQIWSSPRVLQVHRQELDPHQCHSGRPLCQHAPQGLHQGVHATGAIQLSRCPLAPLPHLPCGTRAPPRSRVWPTWSLWPSRCPPAPRPPRRSSSSPSHHMHTLHCVGPIVQSKQPSAEISFRQVLTFVWTQLSAHISLGLILQHTETMRYMWWDELGKNTIAIGFAFHFTDLVTLTTFTGATMLQYLQLGTLAAYRCTANGSAQGWSSSPT